MPTRKPSKWQKRKTAIAYKFEAVEETRRQTAEFWDGLALPKVRPRNPRPEPKKKKPATRKEAYQEVAKRDKGVCQFPGCYKRNVNMHHIIFRSHLGKNDVENLVTLCLEHHTVGKQSPHQSAAWRRYWEGWAEEKYPEYWANVREENKIKVGRM